MPAGDGTGPMGTGPMTGRGAGYCGGFDRPGYASPIRGRLWGRGGWVGGGGGHGWQHRHWSYATGLPRWARRGYPPDWVEVPRWAYGRDVRPPTREQELDYLRQQAEWLRQQLDDIAQCIEGLESEE